MDYNVESARNESLGRVLDALVAMVHLVVDFFNFFDLQSQHPRVLKPQIRSGLSGALETLRHVTAL